MRWWWAAGTFSPPLIPHFVTHCPAPCRTLHASDKLLLLPATLHLPVMLTTRHAAVPLPRNALQASKQDSKQPAIASLLPALAPGSSVDALVVGCGPAGISQ